MVDPALLPSRIPVAQRSGPNRQNIESTPSASRIRIFRRKPSRLTLQERDEIARFVVHYIDYPRGKLDEVLDAADYVWLCRDHTGELIATTAVRCLHARYDNRNATVIYTAMVAIHPAFRRLGIIPRVGMRSFLLERLRSPLRPIFWLSLSASPSAYMQMARNFATFWPRVHCDMPASVRSILVQTLRTLRVHPVEELEGVFRLGDEFGVSDDRQDPKQWDRSDPDVDFFFRVNPGYQQGSDLACLCPLDFWSLATAVYKQLRRALGWSSRSSNSATAT